MTHRCGACALVLWAVAVGAQMPVEPDTVVVTARPQPSEAEQTAPRLSFDAEELAQYGALSVGELVRRLPGVSNSGEAGSFESPQLRGLGPQYTQVLIDGRRVPGLAEDRSATLDRIPAELIERVEILRSPTADLDGQGVGGSINLVVKSDAALDATRLRVGSVLDEDGRPRALAHAAHGVVAGPWSTYLGGTVQPSRELRSKRSEIRGADGTLSEMRRGVEVRDGQNHAADARGAYRFENGGSVSAAVRYLRTARDTDVRERVTELSDEPPAQSVLDEREDEYQRTRTVELRATLPQAAGRSCSAVADATSVDARRDAALSQRDEIEDMRIEDERLELADRERRLDGRCNFQHEDGRSLMGLSYGQQRRSTQDRRTEFAEGVPADVSPFGGAYRLNERRTDAFVQHRWLAVEGLEFDAGLRLETTRRGSGDTDLRWLPNLHLRADIGAHSRMQLSIARTIRRPGFDQLTPFRQRDGDVFRVGNPRLRDETALGIDAGLKHAWPVQGIELDGNLFFRQIDDLIQDVAAGPDTRGPDNRGRGRAWGLEGSARYALDSWGMPAAGLSTQVALIDSSVRDPQTGEMRRFQGQSPYTIGLMIEQASAPQRLGWGLAASVQDDAEVALDDAIERVEYRIDLDAHLSAQLGPGTELRMSGRNLLDARTTETRLGFDAPRGVGSLETVEREREALGPSLVLSISHRIH